MERLLVLRGALAGVVGGLLAFAFARVFSEPQISAAIDYENGRDAAQAALNAAAGLPADSAGPDVFTRGFQANLGLGLGVILFGIALGVVFAVVYAICLGRVGNVGARSLALLLAGAAFVSVYLVPYLKYPANPPSIGHADTIKQRTAFYLIMVIASVVFLLLAIWVGRLLHDRLGTWNACLLAGLFYAVAVGIVMAILPELGRLGSNVANFGHHATETPLPLRDAHGTIVYPGFPADVLFKFRLFALGTQAVLWATIALVFAPLADRVLTAGFPANQG